MRDQHFLSHVSMVSPWCYKVLQRRTSINPGPATHAVRAPWLNSFAFQPFSQAQHLTVPRTHREESPFPLCNAIIVQGLVRYADLMQQIWILHVHLYTATFCGEKGIELQGAAFDENVNYFLRLCKQRKRQYESPTLWHSSNILQKQTKYHLSFSGNDPQPHKPHPLQREKGSSHVAAMKLLPETCCSQ